MLRHVWIISIGWACLTVPLRADTLWISSTGGNPIAYTNSKVVRVEGDQIHFRTSTGQDAKQPLKNLVKMAIDDEPAFSAGEQAFSESNWELATDGYQKTLKATSKPWLKDFSAIRLMQSAEKSGRFDAAVSAYIALVMKDPALAAGLTPKMPAAQSTYLDSAVLEINQTIQGPRVGPEQKRALLGLLMEIHRTKGDGKAAGEVAQELLKLGIEDGSASPAVLAEMRLGIAHVALDQKEWDKALEQINQNKAIFAEPKLQADALFCIAEAMYGKAGNNPEALKNAALAYMRIPANFSDAQAIPQIWQSLLKTAEILEKLNDRPAALELYRQIAAEHSATPAAATAKQAIARLGAPQ